MRRLITVIFGAVLSAMAADAAFADKRVALVVGNSAYRSIPSLDNPKNDARLMSDTLRALGFTLVGGGAQLDLDKGKFDALIQEFGNRAGGADVALFYYAGHGLQARGVNYLVPVAANPTKEADLDFQMVDVNLVLRQMESAGTKLNLVVLDACRNNPFGGRGLRTVDTGLAQMRAPEGTLISFATQPGAVAQDGTDGNSPYTKAFAQTIRTQGLGIFEAVNRVGLEVKRTTGGSQQPWFSSSPIDGNFYFAAAPANAPAVPPPVAAVPPAPSADEITWNFLKDTSDVTSLQRFLTQFPASRFRGEVQTRIAALERAAQRPAPPQIAATPQLPPPPAPAPVILPQQQAALAPPVRPDTGTPIDTRAIPQLSLKIQTVFPKSSDAGDDAFVKRLTDLSGGRLKADMLPAGAVVPAFQALDAVSSGVLDAAWSVGAYNFGRDPAFQLLTSIPFGFDPLTHVAWRRQSDVAGTIDKLVAQYKAVAIPCGTFGASVDLFSKRPIRSTSDLRGLKVRVTGLHIPIFTKVGAASSALPGGEIVPALERGIIDAAVWSDPHRSDKLGLLDVVRYVHAPGSLSAGDVIDLFVSQSNWEKLGPAGRQAVQRACAENLTAQHALNDQDNKAALDRMRANGAIIAPLPQDVRRDLYRAWESVAQEQAAKSPTFKTLFDLANQRRSEMVASSLR